MKQRCPKREMVWNEMQSIEENQLGERRVVSDDRDKFMLNPDHQAAYKLSRRPDANGFIRADSRSLLFRDPSDELRSLLISPYDMSFDSEKGVEFRWANIDEAAISRFFEHVTRLAADSLR